MRNSPRKSRYGFYYFPDTLHYRESDTHTWISELNELGASWLTLCAPLDRTIPETFLQRIIQARIEPILHFRFPTLDPIHPDELNIIFNAYSHWGVKYVSLFDRPNLRTNWAPADWAKNNLVERFLDIFTPLAQNACENGLIPVFPPLEPGGDYWDTAFLFSALQSLQRRGLTDLLDHLVISAYAWPGNRSLEWGTGGPERWPNTRPYLTPQDSEDQLGFRIFDWYLAITNAAIGRQCPIILMAAGSRIGDQPDPRSPSIDVYAHTWQNIRIVQMMSGRSLDSDPVPAEVLCCNFWLLSTAPGDKNNDSAWYKADRSQLPIVQQLKEWVVNRETDPSASTKTIPIPKYYNNDQQILHYLLLPNPEWGATDYHLEAIQPFIKKYRPTIGFSPVEASHAKKVTVIGGPSNVPDSIIDGLLAAGCIVEQISGDGMNIASSSLSDK